MTNRSTIEMMRRWQELGFLRDEEISAAEKLTATSSPFAGLLGHAESLHVHLKVDDTAALPRETFEQWGGAVEFEKPGFIKFRFDDGVRFICSSIPVAVDENIQRTEPAQSRPFVDHFGIDLRNESDASRRLFDSVPEKAQELGWGHVPQGGGDRRVHCCHTEVKAKHWVYPTACWDERMIPLEFAFGELVVNAAMSGCDLRPMNPAFAGSGEANSGCCC